MKDSGWFEPVAMDYQPHVTRVIESERNALLIELKKQFPDSDIVLDSTTYRDAKTPVDVIMISRYNGELAELTDVVGRVNGKVSHAQGKTYRVVVKWQDYVDRHNTLNNRFSWVDLLVFPIIIAVLGSIIYLR